MGTMRWAELGQFAANAKAGDYLAEYEDDDLDDVSDSGSRCGYGDDELAYVEGELAKRGLALTATDVGLIVVDV